MILAGCCFTDMDMPLSQAAVIAYRDIFTKRPAGQLPTNDELDLVALVLSSYVPVYGGEGRARLTEAELAEGMFWGGARRFESRHGLPVGGLVVRRDELEQALERLRAEMAA
jgi:hypothetical protein